MRFLIRSVGWTPITSNKIDSNWTVHQIRLLFIVVAVAVAIVIRAATVRIENGIKWRKRFRRCVLSIVEHHVHLKRLLVYQRDIPNHFVELNRIGYIRGKNTMSKHSCTVHPNPHPHPHAHTIEESTTSQVSHFLCNSNASVEWFGVAYFFSAAQNNNTIYHEAYSGPKEQFFRPTWWWFLNNIHRHHRCQRRRRHYHRQTTVNFKQSTFSKINNIPTDVIKCRWTNGRKMWQPLYI